MIGIADYINSSCHVFDHTILNFFHSLATHAGEFLTPFAKILAVIGDNGYFSFAVAIILLLFAKTRKCGTCMIFSVGIGALFTNVLLKNIVARPRPFQAGNADYTEWWEYIGKPTESGFSFPSGHTTAATSAMVALCIFLILYKNKAWLLTIPAALYAVVMGLSRNYLMVHYPSDVVAGFAIGIISAALAYFTVKAIWQLLEKHAYDTFPRFVLGADIRSLIRLTRDGK